jgi:threonine dehydratase
MTAAGPDRRPSCVAFHIIRSPWKRPYYLIAIAANVLDSTRRVLKVALHDITEARERLKGLIVRTPLVRLNLEDAPADIYLKLENLQPTGSFKARGAGNAVELLSPEQRARGVYTCSGGNMAQALAWHAHRHRIPCTAIVPDTAAETKIDGIRRYGADIIQVPFEEVWKVATDHVYPPLKDRTFVHPFSNAHMIAGNGTLGLEILEDLPDVDSVIVPFGGGGLFTGIAIAIKAHSPQVKMYGCEPDTACAFAASLAAGTPKHVDRVPSFLEGTGESDVLPEIWDLVRPLASGSLVVSLSEVASAVRILFERHRVVAEGSGASSLAAALKGGSWSGPVVCVMSGGNIDPSTLGQIMDGEIPEVGPVGGEKRR